MHRFVLALFALLILTACEDRAEEWPADVDLTEAEIAEMNDFATDVLDGLQARSFEEEREFCGYILLDETGAFSTTEIVRGDFDSCDPGPLSIDIVASFHTHGAYAPDYNSEFPSTDDLLGDFEAGIDGYVSTPSGRIWRISHDTERARMLCGVGCVLSDPDDVPEQPGALPRILTLEDIEDLEE